MRIASLTLALGLSALASQATAWRFSPLPICTLSATQGAVSATVTYDAAVPEYTIVLDRAAGWPEAPVFAIRFEGPRPLTISTDRHVIDGTTLSVSDRGFGNVLNGMEFNEVAFAILGDVTVPIVLGGMAEPMEAFRACPAAPSV
ncbi:excinuclease ABC subunit B [Roseobacteraceae bacterium S113]